MLVLSRKLNETIVIRGDIRITIVGVRGNQVRLGIEAPDSVAILRQELCEGTGGRAKLARRVSPVSAVDMSAPNRTGAAGG
jgi:carbon storage regulator